MSTANTLAYRCVCGQTIQVDSRVGGGCDTCGRTYSGNAVNASMSVTIGMPTDVRSHEDDPESDGMVGRSLDHFTIIDRLGGGGMGTVYRALDESLQRYVAIKVIGRGRVGAGDTEHVERLLQEARAQARVNHANVVHIYFVSRCEELPYLAMELVPGASLAVRLADDPLPYGEVVDIAIQVAEALRESAQFDIVHGDIKPCNILMHNGSAKLSDFGLSQRLSLQTEDDAKVAGTPNYMAPEVCRGELADTRSDQYSFGVMLFEMTFGRLPYSFPDSTLETRFEAHQQSPVEFPLPWPREVPESWRSTLERLLAKSPEDRYSDYDELLTDLRRQRPIDPIPAGRLVRGMAWGIDLTILLGLQTVLLAVVGVLIALFDLPGFFPGATGFAVPVLALLWLRGGGTSLGKKILQLRVVDEHGLPPSRQVLAWRSVFQFLPLWLLPVVSNVNEMGLPGWLTIPVAIAGGLAIVADTFFAVFTPGIRSIHDRIFKTRVVLDSSR